MPLPTALLAKLQQRGIIPKTPESKPEEVEEVFAEDYDDPAKPEPEHVPTIPAIETSAEPVVFETLACPNKWNPYHECSDYCRNKYGAKEFVPDRINFPRRERMLQKYPLPEGWQEIADPTTGRYYYWNTHTDQVSWLSPVHPRAEITYSAEKFQAVINSTTNPKSDDEAEEDDDLDDEEIMDVDSDLTESSSESEDEADRRRRHDRRGRNQRSRGRDVLDPMDPAAYSDIPRGTWSTGLDQRGRAKTGADVTASGPLFQQRPYPSPGDVLRANKQLTGAPPK